MRWLTLFSLLILVGPCLAQQNDVPKDVAGSVGFSLRYAEDEFLSVAEAMPEAKYNFVPTAGNFQGVRSFAEQVKHVACANIAFFNQIEGKTPPDHCEKGGPDPARSKPELIRYLKNSYDYGHRVLATINAANMLQRVDGPYASPDTKLGMAVTAVWHVTDHYGQIVEYLRMNGIVPPGTVQYGVPVR